MTSAIVIVAGGSGTRLGHELPKAFVPLRGRPLIAYAVERAAAMTALDHLVLVVPEGYHDVTHPGWVGVDLPPGTAVVPGGRTRGDSVLAGVHALPDDVDIVLVHDAARCLAPTALFERVRDTVAGGVCAVVPGTPVVDTVKIVDAAGDVVATPDRGSLRAIQTPQGFDRHTLLRAHAAHGSDASDDAALVERLGIRVRVVPGDPRAMKVTTPADLDAAGHLLDAANTPTEGTS